MKKYLLGSVVLLIFIIIYFGVNFLFFDTLTLHQSEKQLNNYVENHKDNKLKQMSSDDKTYQFLKKQQKISIKRQSDNQGSGSVNYYQVKLNNHSAELYIHSKNNEKFKKTTIQRIRVY